MTGTRLKEKPPPAEHVGMWNCKTGNVGLIGIYWLMELAAESQKKKTGHSEQL